ncbi:MAG: Do family serine endopeptidase [Methylovirgula sp.]
MTEVSGQRPSTSQGRARSKRLVLLGTTAALVLGGAAVSNIQGLWATPARAETGSVAPLPANAFSFADVVDRVRGAVVSIKVKIAETADAGDSDDGPQQLSPDDPLERFFRRFGGEEGTPFVFRHGHPHVEMAQGSGFIISPDGYVVTNNHVVDQATEVTITMDDGTTHPAKVIGTDKRTDLALLKINSGGPFKYVSFAAKPPRVGDWVIAVGNPFGLGGTVTAGIVSAHGRDINSGPYDDYLQIDAPVNRGNSGGPTFDTQGEVVGINTAIYSPSGGSVGIGFDIPADEAHGVIAALESKGVVTRGWIGVQIQPVTSDIADSLGLKSEKGALVADTEKDSPALKAGIKTGDIILGVNGEQVDGPRELARKIAALGPNVDASLLVWHDGAQKTYDVKLGTLPNEQVASADADSGNGTDSGASALATFGLTLAPSDSVPGAAAGGVVVTNIDPDGTAAQKGLKVGDVILQAGGKSVTTPGQVADVLSDAKKAGRKAILLRIKSGDETHFVALELGKAS